MKFSVLALVIFGVFLNVFSVSGQSLNDIRKLSQKPFQEIRKVKQDQKRLERLTRSRNKKVDQTTETGDTIFWADFRYVPKQGVLGEHRAAFKKLHGEQVKLFLDENKEYKEIYYDTTFNTYFANTGLKDTIDAQYQTIGWYPGYNGLDTSMNFRAGLLSMVSYNFCLVDPVFGAPQPDDHNMDVWKAGFVNIMKKRNPNMKVLLNVHMYFSDEISGFLDRPFAKRALIDSVYNYVYNYGADGVEISFSNPDPKDSVKLNDFLVTFASRLGGAGKTKKTVVLTLDPLTGANPYNFDLLDEHVDYYVLNSFNIINAINGSPGPVAPLSTIENAPSINKSFYGYFLGTKVDAGKVILGMPLMAPQWTIKPQKNNFGVYERYELKDNLSYAEILSEYKSIYGEPAYDYITGSSFYLTPGDETQLVWFESTTSLDIKFKWAKDNRLAGVGLWELGNEGSYQDVWNIVADNFARDSLEVIKPIGYENDKLYGLMANVSSHRKHVAAGVVIIIGFIVVGFLMTFLDWRVREVFFKNYDYRLFFAIIIIILCAIPVALYLLPTTDYEADVTKSYLEEFIVENELAIVEKDSLSMPDTSEFGKQVMVANYQDSKEPQPIVLKQGDGAGEDVMEVLASALGGGLIMYLVTLIYVRRRSKMP